MMEEAAESLLLAADVDCTFSGCVLMKWEALTTAGHKLAKHEQLDRQSNSRKGCHTSTHLSLTVCWAPGSAV